MHRYVHYFGTKLLTTGYTSEPYVERLSQWNQGGLGLNF